MGWIAINTELIDHIKTRRTAKLLNIPPITVAGHLLAIWIWCDKRAKEGDEQAEQGIIGNPKPWAIAEIARWEGDPDRLIEVLLDVGWLDRADQGLVLHDWMDHQGAMIQKQKEKRERNAKRMRDARAPNEESTDGNDPLETPPVHCTCNAQPCTCYAVQPLRHETNTKDDRVVVSAQARDEQPIENTGQGADDSSGSCGGADLKPEEKRPLDVLEARLSPVFQKCTFTAREYQAMGELFDLGIPVDFIVSSAKQLLEEKKAAGDDIKSFAYFKGQIVKAFEAHQEREKTGTKEVKTNARAPRNGSIPSGRGKTGSSYAARQRERNQKVSALRAT